MRDLHEQMIAAVLNGEGLEGIAELASHQVGATVAILLPERGLSASWPERDLAGLETWATSAVGGSNGTLPENVDACVPILAGGEELGRVVALSADEDSGAIVDREEVLRSAALAALSALAVIEARDLLAEQLRGSFMEDLRSGQLDRDEIVRRGKRLGAELSRGAVAIAARADSGKPHFVAAMISSAAERAIAEPIGECVLALLAPGEADDAAERVQARAQSLVDRLRAHGPAACSSFYGDPGDLGRAVEEAELVLEVVARDPRLTEQMGNRVDGGVYRLLFRALASNPAEVSRFYEDTVGPLVAHDRDYRTDLLNTLEGYLANDCNMRATAEAVYAHRHTVAHRLERVRELTGLDPASGTDRERLGLGIKAYRLIEPTLPR